MLPALSHTLVIRAKHRALLLEENRRLPALVLPGLWRIEPEDVEDRQDRLAGGAFGKRAVEPQRLQELVDRAVVVFARRQEHAQPVARPRVAWVTGGFAGDVLVRVLRCEVLEEQTMLED